MQPLVNDLTTGIDKLHQAPQCRCISFFHHVMTKPIVRFIPAIPIVRFIPAIPIVASYLPYLLCASYLPYLLCASYLPYLLWLHTHHTYCALHTYHTYCALHTCHTNCALHTYHTYCALHTYHTNCALHTYHTYCKLHTYHTYCKLHHVLAIPIVRPSLVIKRRSGDAPATSFTKSQADPRSTRGTMSLPVGSVSVSYNGWSCRVKGSTTNDVAACGNGESKWMTTRCKNKYNK